MDEQTGSETGNIDKIDRGTGNEEIEEYLNEGTGI